MMIKLHRSIHLSVLFALLVTACVSPSTSAQEPSQEAKRKSLTQKISALSQTMKEKLGQTFSRSEDGDATAVGNACRCCQSSVCSADVEPRVGNANPASMRQVPDQIPHLESEQSFARVGDRRTASRQMSDFAEASVQDPNTSLGSYPAHSPVHVSKHQRTEAAEFREFLNGDSRTEKAAFYDDSFVGDGGQPNHGDYNATGNSDGFRQDQYYHALPTDADAGAAHPALPNPVLAAQNAAGNRYPGPARGQVPPYEGYHLGSRQITATEHALFLKSENETLKASQRALLDEKKSMRETIEFNQGLLAKSELAMSRALEQLKAAERRNEELEQRYAALEQEHKRFVRETDRTLDSIRNDLDEVLVSEINATR